MKKYSETQIERGASSNSLVYNGIRNFADIAEDKGEIVLGLITSSNSLKEYPRIFYMLNVKKFLKTTNSALYQKLYRE